MKINFECATCNIIFDLDVGNVSINESTCRPIFEKGIECPNCGKRTMDEVFLTELGQSQLTVATDEIDKSENNGDGIGECAACGLFQILYNNYMCEECTGMLERDLIRQKDWEYSAIAYGMSDNQREELYKETIRKYGNDLEMIKMDKRKKNRNKRKRKTRTNRKKRRN